MPLFETLGLASEMVQPEPGTWVIYYTTTM